MFDGRLRSHGVITAYFRYSQIHYVDLEDNDFEEGDRLLSYWIECGIIVGDQVFKQERTEYTRIPDGQADYLFDPLWYELPEYIETARDWQVPEIKLGDSWVPMCRTWNITGDLPRGQDVVENSMFNSVIREVLPVHRLFTCTTNATLTQDIRWGPQELVLSRGFRQIEIAFGERPYFSGQDRIQYDPSWYTEDGSWANPQYEYLAREMVVDWTKI